MYPTAAIRLSGMCQADTTRCVRVFERWDPIPAVLSSDLRRSPCLPWDGVCWDTGSHGMVWNGSIIAPACHGMGCIGM